MKTLVTAFCLAALIASSAIATAAPRDARPSAPVAEFYPDVAKGDINGN